MEEMRRLLHPQVQQNTENTQNETDSDDEEEEWSDEISDEEDSYYTDSDSSVPEWESSINDATGALFFIDCHPFVTQNAPESPQKPKTPEPFPPNQLRRSTRSKFLRLIRRRESKRRSSRRPLKPPSVEPTLNKVKFHDAQEGEEKEVTLKTGHFGQADASLAETLLGVHVGTLSDGKRLMISGFAPDSPAKLDKNVKIGDWLKSINGVSVSCANLEAVLGRLRGHGELHLQLQRVAGVEVTKERPINELNSQSAFVRDMTTVRDEAGEAALNGALVQHAIGVAYLDLTKLSETSTEFEDIIYCYPQPIQKSILCQSRGIFITLNHLINDVTKTLPKSTSFSYKNRVSHLIYYYFGANGRLLLFLVPDYCAPLREARAICDEIVRSLLFLYESIENCFSLCKVDLNQFFGRVFVRLLNRDEWTSSENVVGFDRVAEGGGRVQFEGVLPAARVLYLPGEAQVQIDDALSELEASDYREWNEEPLDCQRLFTILGSAVYHFGYLLASHLIHDDLIDIHSFCNQSGFFHLSKNEPIKTLVYWKDVFPSSCRPSDNNTGYPDGKRYLLVVGSGKDLLAVLMEAGGCTEAAEPHAGPEAFYVEEAQATLSHLQELGVPELAERFLATNPGRQVTIPETSNKRKSDFKMAGNLPNSKAKKPEVTSILKRRNSDQNSAPNAAFFDVDEQAERFSEDSGSQGTAPGDESDPDEIGEGSHLSNSSFDISELRQSLLTETEDYQPQQLTAGNENVLFHFVQFIASEGVLICPPDCRLQSKTLELILASFREACQKIHGLFENTMRFKNMPAQDMAKSVMNKSLIAIKEHGVMFECPFLDDDAKKHKINYWVIGRLFYMPHPKEVYICYQDTIPQNIIELAFKIDLSTI